MTTDTALLVSYEIVGMDKPYESLKFVDEPCVPMDDSVVHMLDKLLPISKLV